MTELVVRQRVSPLFTEACFRTKYEIHHVQYINIEVYHCLHGKCTLFKKHYFESRIVSKKKNKNKVNEVYSKGREGDDNPPPESLCAIGRT